MFLPVEVITANLHPFLNPGSIPMMHFPLTGEAISKFFKLVANTSIDDFSAFFVNSDLKENIYST